MENSIYNREEVLKMREQRERNNERLSENREKMKSIKKKRTALFVFEVGYVLYYFLLIVAAVMSVRFGDLFTLFLFMAPVVAVSFIGTVDKTEPLLFRKILLPCLFIGFISAFIAKGLMIAFLISAVLDFIYYHLALEEVAMSEQPGYPYFIEGIEERMHHKEYVPVNTFESYREKSGDMDRLDLQNMTNNDWVRKESGSESAEMEGISL